MMFSIDYKSNKLTPLDASYLLLEPEAGPRHMTFHNTLNKAYVINELNNTITILNYDASTGVLEALNSVTTLPDNFTGESYTADIHITDDGKFLYGTNRGHNSIAMFEIASDGSLLSLGHESTRGDHPRNFLINKNELYVANQNSDNVVVFEIKSDGRLKFKYELNTNTPVCLRIIEVEG